VRCLQQPRSAGPASGARHDVVPLLAPFVKGRAKTSQLSRKPQREPQWLSSCCGVNHCRPAMDLAGPKVLVEPPGG
jgi:hypothetical protein